MKDAPRALGKLSLPRSAFPREFASFVNFIGPDALDTAIRKVVRKLTSYSPSVQTIFGDRFFFHQQWNRFVDAGFQFDIGDPVAVRAASLIAGINRVRGSLSAAADSRFRQSLIGILRPDQDIRQLEHEIRCYAHLVQKGLEVTFADLEGLGRYDFLVRSSSAQFEIEYKTISEETGSQFKRQMAADLFDIFYKNVHRREFANESGMFVLELKKPVGKCTNLSQDFKTTLHSRQNQTTISEKDFTLIFVPRPKWDSIFKSSEIEEIQQSISSDSEIAGSFQFITRTREPIVG